MYDERSRDKGRYPSTHRPTWKAIRASVFSPNHLVFDRQTLPTALGFPLREGFSAGGLRKVLIATANKKSAPLTATINRHNLARKTASFPVSNARAIPRMIICKSTPFTAPLAQPVATDGICYPPVLLFYHTRDFDSAKGCAGSRNPSWLRSLSCGTDSRHRIEPGVPVVRSENGTLYGAAKRYAPAKCSQHGSSSPAGEIHARRNIAETERIIDATYVCWDSGIYPAIAKKRCPVRPGRTPTRVV